MITQAFAGLIWPPGSGGPTWRSLLTTLTFFELSTGSLETHCFIPDPDPRVLDHMILSSLGHTLPLFSVLRSVPTGGQFSCELTWLHAASAQPVTVMTFLRDLGRGSVGESKVKLPSLPLSPSTKASSEERVIPDQRSLIAKAFPSSPVWNSHPRIEFCVKPDNGGPARLWGQCHWSPTHPTGQSWPVVWIGASFTDLHPAPSFPPQAFRWGPLTGQAT